MTVIVQPGTDSNGNPQPMVYDSDTGKVIVDSNGYVLNGGQRLVNIPSKTDYVSTAKTQTAGIQEAINYAVSTGNTTIMLKNGIYYLTNDFTTNDTYSVQYQIILPPTSEVTHLRFTSESPVQLGIPNGSMATTGAIIYSKPPSYPSATSSPNPWVMFVAPTYDLEIDVLIRQVGTTQQVNGINLYGAYTFTGNIRCDIDAEMNSGAPSTPPSGLSTLPVASAIQTPNESYGQGFNRLSISVFGYYQGIILNSQTEIESAYFSYVFAPVQVSSTLHPKIIHYINNNNCTHLFSLGVGGAPYTEIYAELADIQDNLSTTSWFETVDHVYYGNPVVDVSFQGTNCAGLIRGVRNPQGSTIPYNSPLTIGGSLGSAISTLRIETADTSGLSVTTPSVPTSATAQENTNPYPVNVYVYGGDVTEIQITKNGTAYTVLSVSTAIAMSGQAYRLNPGDSITVTYSTAPSWEWLSD